jgi:hypothetical protein
VTVPGGDVCDAHHLEVVRAIDARMAVGGDAEGEALALEPLDLLAGADKAGEQAEIGGIEEHGDLGLTIDGKHCVMRPN